MLSEFRDFLELSYEELEDLNLRRKSSARSAWPPSTIQEERLKYLTDEKRHQGRDRAVQRPRRPAAHARLRQEVPGQELRQPDVRRLVDPRLYGAAGERSAAGHRLERVLLGAGGRVWAGQGAWCSAK